MRYDIWMETNKKFKKTNNMFFPTSAEWYNIRKQAKEEINQIISEN